MSSEPSNTLNFSTEPKSHSRRGHSPVRARCLEFIEILRDLGYVDQIPLKEAKQIFQTRMSIMDRGSLAAYFGSQASISRRRIQRVARYSTGTISFKNIELTQEIQQKKGYLELLGLATYEKQGATLFMVLQDEVLVPQLSFQHYEGVKLSKDKISLTPILQRKECEKTVLEIVSPCQEKQIENKTNNNIQDEREKLNQKRVSQHFSIELTAEEQRVLDAAKGAKSHE